NTIERGGAYAALFERNPDPIVTYDLAGLLTDANPAALKLSGYALNELRGVHITRHVHPEHAGRVKSAVRAAIGGRSDHFETTIVRKSGARIPVECFTFLVTPQDGPARIFVVARDLTALKSAQRAAQRAIVDQNERIRSLYLVTASGASTSEQIDLTLELGCRTFGFEFGYIAKIDEQKLRLLNVVGPPHSILPGMSFPRSSVLAAELRPGHDILFIPDLAQPPWGELVARLGHPWKSYFALLLTVENAPFGALVFADRLTRAPGLKDEDRDLARLMGVFIAAAIERSERETRVEQLAFHDSLTGLPNRVLFEDRVTQAVAAARRYDRGFALMYLDLDDFKSVNDDLGHPAGDLLLRAVADRLPTTVRESDTVARFGGDEFVILQPVAHGSSDAADMARKIVAAMQLPFELGNATRTIQTSIGIALYPSDADKALYRAKRAGRNRWVLASESAQT
ncbi:MAG: diguanylate cyclase, partial [Candidatus Eremiobacteraeota bacterium]|nr:diguanylate cyclase [Candidatus Eremiobacteraeota bacterium]